MAPKNQSRFVDQPPSASSCEEEEDSSQEEEEQYEEKEKVDEEEEDSGEEESDEEEPKSTPLVGNKSSTQKPSQVPPKPSQVPEKPSQIPQKPISSSESETEEGSGSDSDETQPSPSASDFTAVKPSVPPKATSKTPSKRSLETQKEDDSKNKKTKIAEDDSKNKKTKIAEEDKVEKKSLFSTPNRLWSEDDQVAILKGILEFKSQKGLEPNADMSAFHDFVKGKLHVEVSKSQLSDKMRRLKKKFISIIEKGEKPVFSKPHEFLMFEISKKIWGNGGKGDSGTSDGVDENVNKLNGESKTVKKKSESNKSSETKEYEKHVAVKEAVKENFVKGEDFQSKYPCLVASIGVADLSAIYPVAAEVFKENMSLISSDRAQVLEEKWKKLRDEEADLMMKRLDLIKEYYELVVKAMRGN